MPRGSIGACDLDADFDADADAESDADADIDGGADADADGHQLWSFHNGNYEYIMRLVTVDDLDGALRLGRLGRGQFCHKTVHVVPDGGQAMLGRVAERGDQGAPLRRRIGGRPERLVVAALVKRRDIRVARCLGRNRLFEGGQCGNDVIV